MWTAGEGGRGDTTKERHSRGERVVMGKGDCGCEVQGSGECHIAISHLLRLLLFLL